ncbi:hypothetical protein QNZ47_004571, partial [Enterobacter cloacae]|nr:hypothetical protein [Enterobacter cloacae]
AVRMWVGALGGLTRLRAEGIGGEGDTLMLKGILAASGLGMLVWARALLRAARLQAGDGQGWRAFREWGVPVVLIVAALVLICISDGGRVDHFLARAHWRFLAPLQVVPSPDVRDGDALTAPHPPEEGDL